MFSVGDILIKIDVRARFLDGFNTQHHAMLIVAVDDNGHPQIAHMKFTDLKQQTGGLVIESCPNAKDLILIHSPAFSETLRNQIANVTYQAHQNNQLIINRLFLEQEYNTTSHYRWNDLYHKASKLYLIRQEPIQAKNILSDMPQFISCHDFVLSAIHCACHSLSEPIPPGLNISPRLAWSDILRASCIDDNSLKISYIQGIRSENTLFPSI